MKERAEPKSFLLLVLCCVCLCASSTRWAMAMAPKTGATAPALNLRHLVQGPPDARVDWKALRGKVVIIDFWATWCMPCVANIPHQNELFASLDPSKVVFLSVDDEAPGTIKAFLQKRSISGWVGTDESGAVFRRYGIKGRPTEVIVNADGTVAAVTTHPDQLTRNDILAVVGKKRVKLRSKSEPSLLDEKLPLGNDRDPVFYLSVTRAQPGTEYSYEFSSSGDLAMLGADEVHLLSYAYSVPKDRIVIDGAVPGDTFNIRGHFGKGNDSESKVSLQEAISASLHLRVISAMVEQKALVLTATDETETRLKTKIADGVMPEGVIHGYNSRLRKVHIENGSLNLLATDVEGLLGVPVVNETGKAGTYDFDIPIADGDLGLVRSALRSSLGLDLLEQRRLVFMLDVSDRPIARSSK